MIPRRFRPFLAFAAVIAAAGSVTAAGLTFTAHTVARTVAELPQVKPKVLPSYVVRLPEAKAADLDISKTVAVKPKIKVPVTVPDMPVVQAAVAPPATTEQKPALIAEAPPMDQVATSGEPYIVKSDVSVRLGPSKSYGRVGTVTSGTEVNVTDEDGGWLKVSFNGGSGWVYQSYLAPGGNVAEAETGVAPF